MLIVAPMGPSCGWGGRGTVGKYYGYPTPDGAVDMSVAWILSDQIFAGRVAHEFGHGFGLRHANFLDCKSGAIGSSACVSQEYGDFYSTMGASYADGHFNALHKDYLGWFSDFNIKTVTENGTYVLEPLETQTAGLKALKIQRSANDNLFLEYRQPIGFDSRFLSYKPSSTVYSGGLLHAQNTQVTGSGSLLVDPTPPSSSSTVALLANEFFTDPMTGTNLQVVSRNSGELVVDVEFKQTDATPPSVSFSSPINYATVSGIIKITVSASDESGIKKVDFYKNNLGSYVFLASDSSAPYEFSLDTAGLPNGTNYLRVLAYDQFDNQKEAVLAVSVANYDTISPSVGLTSPLAGSSLTSPVAVSATASDNIGVWKVEFYKDSDQYLFFIDSSSPYTYSLVLSPGAHAVYAKAYDAVANSATTSLVTFTVKEAPDTILPKVTLSSPLSGALLSGIANVSASAYDNVGVARVEFYSDSAVSPFAVDSNSPFSAMLDTKTLLDGRHVLRARAYDAAGNSAVSSDIVLTIDNTLPAVSLIAPQDGAIIRGVAALSASASDNAGLEKVDFYRDNNVLLGTDSSSPYNISLDSTKITNGGHTIFAKATDKAGNAVLSSSRTINADNSPDAAIPSVSITSPLNGELVAGYTTITSSATDDRKISKVEFYVNGRLKCSDSLVDYTCKWLVPAITGGTYQLQAKAYDASGNSAMSATVNVVADNVSPEISVSSPVGGATVASKAVNVSALASDNISVKQLTFYLDGRVIKNVTASPYQFSWDSTSITNGQHTFYAKVYDQIGNSKQSPSITIRVMNNPVVSISSPYNKSFVRGLTNISTGSSGKVVPVKMEFYKDGEDNAFAVDSAGPFSVALDTTAMQNGTHSMFVKAVDGFGNVGTSSPITVTVDNTPPAISLTAPANGASVSGKIVPISATASDNVGIKSVQFYVNGRLVKTDSYSPYEFNWDSTRVLSGTYALHARATDWAGNATESARTSISVAN